MTRRPQRDTHRTLVLSWHPEDGYLSAGGYRRSREIVRRLAATSELSVIDTAPSIYRDLDGERVRIVEYRLPEVRSAARLDSRLARAVQWSLASLKIVWHGVRELRRRPYDALYVPTSELLVCSLPAVVLRQITGRRLVMCNQNVRGIFARRLTLALHNHADAVTVVSEALRRELVREGVRTRIEVNGNGPPPLEADVLAAEPIEKQWDGIFIGRHTTEKGIDDLLEIWRLVGASRTGANLVLVGACAPETKRRIAARIAAIGIEHGIELAGVVSDREKFRLLRSSRVLVAPSRVEGWGLVPLEALSVGTPVVCWDLPAYRESLPSSSRIARVPPFEIGVFSDRVLEALRQADRPSVATDPTRLLATPDWQDVADRERAVIYSAPAT